MVCGDTREAVAYALLIGIAEKEGKVDYASLTPVVKADADWVLEMYRRCWRATKGEG